MRRSFDAYEFMVHHMGREFLFVHTKHLARRNVSVQEGTCACGYHGEVESYDARPWIAVKYIPVIPKARVKVTNHCPRCGRYEEMPMKSWEAMSGRVLREAMGAVSADPGNRRIALLAIETAMQYPANQACAELADLLSMRWPEEVVVQEKLAHLYKACGCPEKAEAAYQKAGL